ncbi:MAG: ATP-binding cassette domain-containing protein [Acidobacteriota bacterium]
MTADPGANGAVLRIAGLRLRRGARDILTGVDLAVRRGEVVALMGLSGAGKTTVLRVVAGLDRADSGDVHAERVGMVFQFHCLFEHMTALHNVWLAPVHVGRQARAEAERRAQALLDDLGVGHRAHALPRELSGGEAQRVAIARALAMNPPLLLLDEPTASLDPARRTELGESLQHLAGQGRALLVASHDEDFIRACASRVLILAGGRVVEEGDPRRVLSEPSHAATRELLQVERARRGGA